MGSLSLAHEPVTGISHGKLGMWIFLATEIMFFSGFFATFIVMDAANPGLFEATATALNWKLALTNTIILICSSLTMALAILNLERKDTGKFRMFLGLTLLGACGFLIIKTIEYSGKFSHGIGPDTNVFYGIYFLMTGFHGVHVVAGMIPMIWMLGKSFSKKGYTNAGRVEVLGLYWHFVDLVWIFLFPVFYLLYNPSLVWGAAAAAGGH